MSAKQYYIYYNLTDTINYTILLKLYQMATYNKETGRYDTINYKTQMDLANRLNISASSVGNLLKDSKYSNYFTVDKKEKIISLLNDFSNTGDHRRFIVLTASQADYLIQSEADNKNLFVKYFLYIKHHQDPDQKKQLDFTANQFLQYVNYSCKSNNTKDILGRFNKILIKDGYLEITQKYNKKGYLRNYYYFIYK